MRIAVVVPYSLDVPGGVGTHALGEAAWLAEQGHRVTLVAPGTRSEDVPAGVELVLVGEAVGLPFNGSVARLALRPSQARVAVAAAEEAEVVHVHEPLTPGMAFAAARAARNLLVTHHASFTPNRALELIGWRRARTLGSYNAIAVSRAAQYSASSVTGREMDVVPNAIRMPPPPPLPREGRWRGGERPRIAFVGRAKDPRKGFRDFERLAVREADSAEFVALGPDTEHTATPVRGLGQISQARRLELLQGTDVLVAPNRGGESFGMILIEAMAAGCAVLASDLPGFRETLTPAMHDDVAEVFPVGDLDAAADALTRLIDRGPRPATAYRHAAAWSWDAVGPHILARLRQLVSGDGPLR